MTTALTVFRAQIDYLLTADNDELSQNARDEMLKAAVERYSLDRPKERTQDVTGDAGKYYPLTGGSAVLSNWSDGFSRILGIEYPAATIASDEAPQYLEPEDWDEDYWVDSSGDIRWLYLPNHAPVATESMRIKFSQPYAWSGSPEVTDTPVLDFFAICHLAAALCCRAIAAKYSRTSDSSITADSVNHTTKAGEFSRRAKEFEALYNQHLGLGAETVRAAAGEFVDMDTAPGWPSGRQYLYHRN